MTEWQAIATAPKDGTRVDLWAKCWRAAFDDFTAQRFTDCYWYDGDSMMNTRAHWMNLDTNWAATHWMPVPDPPADREAR